MEKIKKQASDNPGEQYTWRHGLVFYKNHVVVPRQTTLTQQLLKEFHNSHIGGHSAVLRTFKRLAQQFYWPFIYRDVHAYVTSCDVCQRAKA